MQHQAHENRMGGKLPSACSLTSRHGVCGGPRRGDASLLSDAVHHARQLLPELVGDLLAVAADAHRLALVQGVEHLLRGLEGQVHAALPVHTEAVPHLRAPLPDRRALQQHT